MTVKINLSGINELDVVNGLSATVANGVVTLTVPAAPAVPVLSVFSRTGNVVAVSGDYTVSQVTGAAPLASPALTGTPTAPTQSPLTNNTDISTTAYADAATAVEKARALAAEALLAPLASPALTGTPTAPTATVGTNTTQLATTAFVLANAGAGSVSSVFGRTGAVVATSGDYTVAQVTGAAPLASPALTGTPTAPTQTPLTSNTDISTTAYADAAVAVETSRALAAEALLAPLASPALTGTPTAPTQTSTDNSTKLATTAFVKTAVAAGPVTSVFGRTGAVVAATSDYSFSQISGSAVASQLPTITRAISFVIDGNGSVPATGVYGQVDLPFSGTITGWVLTADASGSAVIDVLKSTYSGFPTTASIASSDKPTLSSVQKNENLAVSVWTTTVTAGDQLQINLNSVTTCKRLNLTIVMTTAVA